MSSICNYYDTVIQDLRYYANDRRRSSEYREILAMAVSALESANLELKESQRAIKALSDSVSNTMEAFHRIRKLAEEQEI